MKIATVRDLPHGFPKIEAWLEGGEEFIVTWHSKPIARIRSEKGVKKPLPPLPDHKARLRETWGDRFFTQEEVDGMRAFGTGEP